MTKLRDDAWKIWTKEEVIQEIVCPSYCDCGVGQLEYLERRIAHLEQLLIRAMSSGEHSVDELNTLIGWNRWAEVE